MVSELDYVQLLEDFFAVYPESREKYKEMIGTYNMTHDIPKYRMFVKLSPDISDERREFLANGIRSYFRNDITVLLDKKVAFQAVEKSLVLF